MNLIIYPIWPNSYVLFLRRLLIDLYKHVSYLGLILTNNFSLFHEYVINLNYFLCLFYQLFQPKFLSTNPLELVLILSQLK